MSIETILMEAVNHQASDIHITVGMVPTFRVNGMLHLFEDYGKLTPQDTEKIMQAITSDSGKRRLEEYGELDFSYSIKGVGRFRVNIYKQRGSYALALRAVPLNVPTIDEMALPHVLKDLSQLKKGLILVTGPTGSGKSTTLAAMIDHINKSRSCHVLTLEDPIEYLHKHQLSIINQREIGHDSKSYGNALRAALRQDPDVILVGEMRDLESISIALNAAETGHLVLSTLHTVGAVSSIDRVIDLFPTNQQQQIRIQLSGVLQAVISQQLLNRQDDSGRVAAIEIMLSNTAIRNHILEGKTFQILNSIQTGKRQGMISMDGALVALARQGVITKEEALSYAADKEYLLKML